MPPLKLLLTLMSLISPTAQNSVLHAYSPGDVVIGGLFPIHKETSDSDTETPCNGYSPELFLRSQVMVYAIEEINTKEPRMLPNLTLGYDIYDTCGNVSKALRATLQLLKGPESCLVPDSINASLPEPHAKVVVGERYSEVSIAVARMLTLQSVAQISYASTSEILSKKFKFPTFLRTVSSDKFQTQGIYELVKWFQWKSVAIVGSDDEYGKYGSDSLNEIFSQNDVCVSFFEILPGDFNKDTANHNAMLRNVIENIKESSAEAIILFTNENNVKVIMEEVIKENLKRTWIASDTWSTCPAIYKMEGIEKIGEVYGFIYKEKEVPGYEAYVRSMPNRTGNDILMHHLKHYSSGFDEGCNCTAENATCLPCLIDEDESFSIYMAVRVVAEGLRRLLKCERLQCDSTQFTSYQLLQELKKVNMTVNGMNIAFDENGDPSLGYDIKHWEPANPGVDIKTIGDYFPHGALKLDHEPSKEHENVSVFNCSKRCDYGYKLVAKTKKCCYECVRCGNEEYSHGNDTTCESCGERQFAPEGQRDRCTVKTPEFLEWTDPFSIVIASASLLAIILTVAFAIVILINCGTPIVKAIGGCLCYVEVFSLLLSFCVCFTFLGKPSQNSCLGIPLFGISFALCISCILANLIQILLGFSFDPRVGSKIKRLNHPVAVVTIISGVQVGVSIAWLIVIDRSPLESVLEKTILYQCSMSEGSKKFFAATVVYNSFWGLISFLFAFKGRQLPDIYKNASLITVSMILFLIIWVVFLPIFLTMEGKYKPAISSAAILISSSSILGCHLAPKCFIMVFRKQLNNQNAISEYIRKHYERKEMSIISS